jgi:hypothetical protein
MGTKQLLPLAAEYVDAANDAVKFIVVLVCVNLFNQYKDFVPFLGNLPGSGFGTRGYQQAATTGLVVAMGFLVYQLLVSKLVMFVPSPGQATYYMALKHA